MAALPMFRQMREERIAALSSDIQRETLSECLQIDRLVIHASGARSSFFNHLVEWYTAESLRVVQYLLLWPGRRQRLCVLQAPGPSSRFLLGFNLNNGEVAPS